MKAFTKSLVLLAIISFVFVACEDNEKDQLVIPAQYDGSNFAANTTTQSAVRTQLENLTNEAKKGRTPGTVVSADALNQLYTSGTPSLKSITTTYYDSRLTGAAGWLAELAKASGGTYTPGTPNGAQGGTYGGYLFDENGLELEQMMEKGLFGAAMYNHAVTLADGAITPATVDQMVSIFGAHPDFPNTNNGSKAANPDKFLANYAARRDKNDGNGLYSQIKNGFIKLQAAVKAGDDYKTEQNEALTAIFEAWEKANAATIINYCHSAIATLSATNPTDAQKSSALHAYSEGVGFIHGYRGVSSKYKIITDGQIDEILGLMNAPYNGTPTSYKFATDPVNELPKLTQVINKLKTIYKFTDQEIEDFKKNWVSEQGR